MNKLICLFCLLSTVPQVNLYYQKGSEIKCAGKLDWDVGLDYVNDYGEFFRHNGMRIWIEKVEYTISRNYMYFDAKITDAKIVDAKLYYPVLPSHKILVLILASTMLIFVASIILKNYFRR